ncbi:MAG: cyclic nucleotide-binding domain-containing protein [Thermodesulfobacteriota bacterium]
MDLGTYAEFPVFKGVTEKDLAEVLRLGVETGFGRGAVILKESGKSSDLFILLSGRVSVEMEASGASSEGRRDLLVRLRPGDVFGEMAFLDHSRRSAYVVASDDITCLRLDGEGLERLMESNAVLGYRLMRNLARILASRLVDSNFRWRNELAGPRI